MLDHRRALIDASCPESWAGVAPEDLRAGALTSTEATVRELVTRAPGESYELHALRIAHAPGPAGRLARAVKRADLQEHLERDEGARFPGAPPYAWALVHIENAQRRRDEIGHELISGRAEGASGA